MTLTMNGDLNVAALVIKGTLVWDDSTTRGMEHVLCAGFIAIEASGQFLMDLQESNGWIYLKVATICL